MKDGVKRIELERQIKEEKEKELVERGREWIDVEKGDMGLREKVWIRREREREREKRKERRLISETIEKYFEIKFVRK